PAPRAASVPPTAAPIAAPRSSPAAASAPPAPVASPLQGGDLRARLHAALISAKKDHLADAVEHCEVTETPTEIIFTTAKMYQMFLKDAALDAAVRQVIGGPKRITVKVGDVAA